MSSRNVLLALYAVQDQMLVAIVLIWLQDGDSSLSDMVAVGEGDSSRALAQALQDKVFYKEYFTCALSIVTQYGLSIKDKK